MDYSGTKTHGSCKVKKNGGIHQTFTLTEPVQTHLNICLVKLLLYDTSIQRIPLFRGHKIWS